MKTMHRWFPSGRYSLIGHLDRTGQCGETGVVIVPPFGWEGVCSYRPLRFLARSLADRGIPCLRYDLPGTGSSSGDLLDSRLTAAWIRSVADADAELRDRAGVRNVVLLGVGFGAMLAVAAANRMPEIRNLILWGAFSSGRAMLRELHAYANLERWEYTTPGVESPPQPIAGFEVGGFLITPEIQRDLEALDFTTLPAFGKRRVLLFSRDRIAADTKLVRALASAGCEVRLKDGTGYEAMMALPNESVPPPASVAVAIAQFLPAARSGDAFDADAGASTTLVEPRIVESIHTVGSMFGVLCEPAETNLRSECCVLFLNAGAVGHSGPNRMWTDAARRNAARGVVSFRFDLPGIGESDGDRNLDIPSLYQEALVEQVELAMDSLRSRLGVRRFIAIGLCSGAFWAFCAAIRNRDVCSAVLLNPRLFFWDPEVDRRRLVRRNAARLANGSQWRRILRGEMSLENVKAILGTLFDRSGSNWKGAFRTSQIPGRRMADAWKAIERNGSRVTLIFTDGEPLLCEMEQEGQMPPENPRVRLVRMGSAGHTFRPQWSQKLAHDLIDREIECAASMPEVRAVLT